jgi:hypothetical protein
MIKTAYVIENDIVVNLIAADENTDLAAFNAQFVEDFYPLHIGCTRKDGQWYYDNGMPVPRLDLLEMRIGMLKDAREELLKRTDWTQLPDSPLSPELKQEWAVYRQALRDMPAQPGFPENVNFPAEPGQTLV